MGRVTAKGVGAAALVITAVCCAASDTVKVIVDQEPASVVVTPSSVQLSVGQTQQLAAVVRDAQGNVIQGAAVSWASRAAGVASVNEAGRVTGHGTGQTTIDATAGSAKTSVPVTVGAQGASPGRVSDLRVAATTNNSVTLRWTEVDNGFGQPADYAIFYGSPKLGMDPPRVMVSGTRVGATASYVFEGLTPGTGYEYLVVAYRMNGAEVIAGDHGLVQTTTQGAAPGAKPFFSDDFEGYSLGAKVSGGSNGFRWGAASADASGGDHVQISQDIAHSGRRSLKFHFAGGPAGDDAWAEQRFYFGQDLSEVWLEFWVYFPDGSEGLGARYELRENMNNKFVAIWGGGEEGYSSAARVTNEIWGSRGTYNVFLGSDQGRLGNTDFLNQGARGRWIQYRQHVKVADRNRNNGVVRIWIDGVLRTNETQAPLYANTSRDANHLSMGYLLGWSNTGFDRDTNVYVDDVKFYHTNPGW